MLTSRQIERYSRQIITPGFGGAAQERLLAAHVIATGNLDDLDPVLPYLIGAGVGHIDLDTEADSATIASLQERFKDLNSDVELVAADQTSRRCDLLLTIAREPTTVAERIHDLATAHSSAAIVYARLDATAMIAVIPSRPPCMLCAEIDLNVPVDRPRENPGLAAMVAGLEAIKLLARIAPAEARLIEFDGYAATTRSLRQRSGSVSCGCPRVSSR
jgi:hypothetical protein